MEEDRVNFGSNIADVLNFGGNVGGDWRSWLAGAVLQSPACTCFQMND
jgi:hypothetical protein